MKKILLPLMLAASTLVALPAMADDGYHSNRGGGFSGGGNQVSTVQQALQMRDDRYVSLTGHITRQVGDDDYIFQDSTGSIRVEIDDDDWWGVTANPQTMLTIQGEIDRDFGVVKVDVHSVRVARN